MARLEPKWLRKRKREKKKEKKRKRDKKTEKSKEKKKKEEKKKRKLKGKKKIRNRRKRKKEKRKEKGNTKTKKSTEKSSEVKSEKKKRERVLTEEEEGMNETESPNTHRKLIIIETNATTHNKPTPSVMIGQAPDSQLRDKKKELQEKLYPHRILAEATAVRH